ncbi:hypothetical protein M1M07_15340 [Rhodococcus sp. HM1]|uniref:hypothetical protein n=1 Tax=Rhodococcus sp. HM1 TaxID=2937759 RepID=UPI00200A8C0C|nr:hypothetical protein [Rhodococcus sp. HM1]MCK8672475.1 hypothetical protein [Rhodococcus sp. HM1]
MTLTTSDLVTVGDRIAGAARELAPLLAEAGIALPGGSALAGAIAAELLTPPIPGATRTGITWSTSRPVTHDDTVHADVLVTRVADGIVDRYVRLVDDTGTVREYGTETWRLDDPTAAPARQELDFCTAAWGELLRARLDEDAEFASSLSSWDGTIGLRCDDRELHLRIYKGRIVDVTRRTPHGATFTFVAPAHLWAEVVLAERDDFMRRAIGGEFSSSGDGYEYLRLTKPLNIVIAHARALAQEVRP